MDIIVTTLGRAALINAPNTGTAAVTITQVGYSSTAIAPTPAMLTLPGEFKRMDGVAGEVVANDMIHVNVVDASTDAYQVRSFALYLADGTLFALYGQPTPILEKTAGSTSALSIDAVFADISAAQIVFGNANFTNPPATTERQGVVELATYAELIAGDALRVPAAKTIKDAVFTWQNDRLGVGNSAIWHPGNDGAGSGLDADLLDGQQGSWYANIPARLGFTPVQQGTGVSQLPNVIKIGWSGSRVRLTVDQTDMGQMVFDGHIGDVWRASNDGAGSGLDADLLDGVQGSSFARVDLAAGNTFAGGLTAPYLRSTGDATVDGTLTAVATIVTGGAGTNGLFGGNGDGASYVTHNLTIRSHYGIGFKTYDGTVNGFYDARAGRWDVRGGYRIAGVDVWHPGNDGSGSGMDADLLDGQHGSFYTDIPARLGYTPVQQGGGVNQLPNKVYIGWSQSSGLKCTVDLTDQGSFVFDSQIANVWRSSNDGSGSGLDADLLDGVQGANYARTDLGAGASFAGGVTAPYLGSSGDMIAAGAVTGASLRVASGAQANGLFPGGGDGASFATYNLALAVHWGLGLRTYDGSVNGVYDAREGRWNVKASYQVNGINVWHGANDGSGSGLDADLLDGQHGSFYADVQSRLGFTPVRQGGGINQTSNTIYLGWSNASRLRVQVDSSDLGNIVLDGNIADVWRASNDGSGSGLDADLLDGLQGSDYLRDIGSTLEQTGYLKLSNGLILQWGWVANLTNRANNTITFPIAFPNAVLAMWPSLGTGIGIGNSNFSIGAQPLSNSQGRIAIATSSGGTIGCYWYALGK